VHRVAYMMVVQMDVYCCSHLMCQIKRTILTYQNSLLINLVNLQACLSADRLTTVHSMNLRWIPFVLFFAFACSESADTKKHRFLLKGNAELEDQHEEMALQYFNEALKIDSCFADAHNNLGTLHYRQKEYDKAIHYYTQAIACKPDFQLAYFNRANTFYEFKKPEPALSDIKEVLKVTPDTVPAIFLLGLIYTQLQQYQEAENAFKKILTINSANTEALTNLGTVLYYREDYAEAKRYLNRVIGLKPEGDAYNTLSLTALAENDFASALSHVDRALSLQSSNAFYKNNKGYIFLRMNEPDKALPYIDESIVLDPYNAYAYRNKGIYYLYRNDAPNAIRMFEKAISLDDKTEQVYSYLAESYALNKQSDKACEAQTKSREHREKATSKVIVSCK
jgi:tetratricopeptide (TPR) repeat protein